MDRANAGVKGKNENQTNERKCTNQWKMHKPG